jgi:hypothetical protein
MRHQSEDLGVSPDLLDNRKYINREKILKIETVKMSELVSLSVESKSKREKKEARV